MNYQKDPSRTKPDGATDRPDQRCRGVRGWLPGVVCLVFLVVQIAGILDIVRGSAPHSQVVSRADFGEKWPFTVDAGELTCYDGAIVFASGGIEYAVNGIAQERSKRFGWVPIHESSLWKENPVRPGSKISLSPIISWGLASCRRPLNALSVAPEARRGE